MDIVISIGVNKKGFGVDQNPLSVFLFPSPALPGSGDLGMFSDFIFETTPSKDIS